MSDNNFVENSKMVQYPQIDKQNVKYPVCIVWTPIPLLSWLFPIVGHMGICTSSGVVRDFAGPYFVSEDNMAFGKPTKYWQLEPDKVPGGLTVWDRAVADAADVYKTRMHNLCCDNCHSMVAMALNNMRYDNSNNWNMVNVAVLTTFHSKYIRQRSSRSISRTGTIIEWRHDGDSTWYPSLKTYDTPTPHHRTGGSRFASKQSKISEFIPPQYKLKHTGKDQRPAAFEHFVRVSAAERRRAERLLGGGSLGRSFSRSYGAGLCERRSPSANVQPLSSPIQENVTSSIDKDKRRASLRFSSWRSSQGSLSRAFGLKSKSDANNDYKQSPNSPQMASPSSTSENSSMFNVRPDSPQSAIAPMSLRRKPQHRHRRVKSIGDIDSITVTPV